MKILESKNARFVENDEISGSIQRQNLVFKEIQNSDSTSKTLNQLVVFI